MKTDEIRRIFDLAEFCSDNYGNTPAFYDKKAGNWHCLSWIDFYENSKLLALGLISYGVKEGDIIATIFSYNSGYWNMLDMALAQIGAIHVPIYPTISDSDYLFILCQIEAKLIFVSDQYIYNKVTSIQSQVPTLKNIVSVERLANVYNLEELVELGRNSQDSEIAELKTRKNKINPDEVVSIIYTSGTSGFPKGVMLSHKNIISSMLAMAQAQPIERGKKVLSFLPMCHVFERVVNYQSQYKGLEIYYCENLKALMKNLLEVKPHATTVVPRVLEKIIKTVLVNGRKKNFFIRFFIVWAVRFGYKYKPYRKTTAFYRLKHKIAYYFVYQIVRHYMGGKIEYIGCGGAALNHKIASFFWAAKMPVYEGYGLTECSPLVALNFPGEGNYWFGSVGPVVDGAQVKIASDGEILVKGNNVMKGYFKNSELTEETMVDGWLKTGDLGHFLEGQFLQITGRKKQMFKTSFGKYIVPQAIENKFSPSPYIKYVIVIGEGKHCAAAIISPNFEYIRTTFKIDKKISNAKLIKRTDVVTTIKGEIKKINHQLGKTEQLKKHLIVPHSWSSETGEVSPTMKLKRNIIIHKYNRQIHALYQDDSI